MDFRINKIDLNNLQSTNTEFNSQDKIFDEQTFNFKPTSGDMVRGLEIESSFVPPTRDVNAKSESLGNGIYLKTTNDGKQFYEIDMEKFNPSIDTVMDLSLPRFCTYNGKILTKNFSLAHKQPLIYAFDVSNADSKVTKAAIHSSINLTPIKVATSKIEDSYGRHQNTGEIGYIVFQPKKYTNQAIIEHDSSNSSKNELCNTPQELAKIQTILNRRANDGELNLKLVNKLLNELRNGNIAFAHQSDADGNFVNENEFLTLSNDDIKLLLKYSNKAKNRIIKRSDVLQDIETEFRKEYFNLHKIVVDPEKVKPEEILTTKAYDKIVDGERILETTETSVPTSQKRAYLKDKRLLSAPEKRNKRHIEQKNEKIKKGYYYGFKAVENKGVNPYNENGELIPEIDRVLAEAASNVALDMSSSGQCMTGFKHALLTAGIMEDYGEMRDENGNNISRPRDAVEWFKNRPEKFTEIKYIKDEDGTVRVLNSTDISNLPAGYIGLWVPEEGKRFEAREGHAFITNGNGQGNADETDNLNWNAFAKGEHGSFHIFKLNENNWTFNPKTQKLEYIGPETETVKLDKSIRAGIEYKDNGKKAKTFAQSIADNKQDLMKVLNITEEEYNYYANIALAISEVETEAGTSKKANRLDKLANNKKINEIATDHYGTLSSGMTRFKVNDCSDKEKRLMEQFGIETGDMNSLDNPTHSAIATIIHIHTLAGDYEKYKSNDNIGITRSENSLTKEEWQNLFAFEKLFSGNTTDWNKILDIKNILRGKKENSILYQNLVEGAKIFIDTHVPELNQTEYIAARWNGKRRLPPADDDPNFERKMNEYYDNMLQVFIDRQRALLDNGLEPQMTVKSAPVENRSYIGHVTRLADIGYGY